MSHPLKITLVQFDIIWEAPLANREKIENLLSSSNVIGTDIIILPETFSTGFTMNNRAFSESMHGETIFWLKAMAERFQSGICGSMLIEEKGNYYNRFVYVNRDLDIYTYDKRYLFSLANEDKHYNQGENKLIFELNKGKDSWRICPLICYDLRFPEWSRNKEDIDLYIYVANFPSKRNYAWEQLLIARAIENQSYVIGVNRTGVDKMGIEYPGNSLVVDYEGKIKQRLRKKNQVLTTNIHLQPKTLFKRTYPFLEDQYL